MITKEVIMIDFKECPFDIEPTSVLTKVNAVHFDRFGNLVKNPAKHLARLALQQQKGVQKND